MKQSRPLSDTEFNQILTLLKVSDEGAAYLRRVRSNPASRRVQGFMSVSGSTPSPKMDFTHQFESHTVELARIQELELDSTVLEYYEQVEDVFISYISNSGRKCSHYKHFDLLIIRRDEIVWEECKEDSDVEDLVADNAAFYQLDKGVLRSAPCEQLAAAYGFKFRVWTTKNMPPIRRSNINLLVGRLLPGTPPVPEAVAQALHQQVHEHFGIILADLIKHVPDARLADVYTLLARGDLHAELDSVSLSREDQVRIFVDAESLKVFANIFRAPTADPDTGAAAVVTGCNACFYFDKVLYRIIHQGADLIIVQPDGSEETVTWKTSEFEKYLSAGRICGSQPLDLTDESLACIAGGDSADWKVANQAYDKIAPYLNARAGKQSGLKPTTRHIRRQIRAFRECERKYGYGIFALLPKIHQRGNRKPKLTEPQLLKMEEIYTSFYKTPKAPTIASAYALLCAECADAHLKPPHIQTFYLYVANQPKLAATRARQGRRAARDYEPGFWRLNQENPRHGFWAYELGHIDSSELDVKLRCEETGKVLGKPWWTTLIDASNRKVLADVLSFDRASYRTCMSLFRQCVRRHGRLPQTIVVDHGTEYASVYFETLMRGTGITVKMRRVDDPKDGNICERFFGTTMSGLISTLAGNTKLSKRVRLVTKDFDPTNLATWTLEALTLLLEDFVECYEGIPHPTLLKSPRQAFLDSLAKMGERSNIRIPYNQLFEYLTMPPFSNEYATINPRYGIKINGIEYHAEEFRNPLLAHKRVEGRYDPDDASRCIVKIDDRWVTAVSDPIFVGMSEKQRRIFTAELLERKRQQAKGATGAAMEKGKILQLSLQSEKLLNQALKDRARRRSQALREAPDKPPLLDYLNGQCPPSVSAVVAPKPGKPTPPANVLSSVFSGVDLTNVPKLHVSV